MELRHLGGALARADGRAVAGRRDGEFVLYTGSALPTPADREPRRGRPGPPARRAGALGIGAVTPAFLAGPHVTGADLRSAYRPGDRARLHDVKRAWDPADMFRVAQVARRPTCPTGEPRRTQD